MRVWPVARVLNSDNDLLVAGSGQQRVVRLNYDGFTGHLAHEGMYGAVRELDYFDPTVSRSSIKQVGTAHMRTHDFHYYNEEGNYVLVESPFGGDSPYTQFGGSLTSKELGLVDVRASGDGADWTYVPPIGTPCDGVTFALWSPTPLGASVCGCRDGRRCFPALFARAARSASHSVHGAPWIVQGASTGLLRSLARCALASTSAGASTTACVCPWARSTPATRASSATP